MKYFKFIIASFAIISSINAYPYNGEDRCGGVFGKCDPGECCSKYGYCGKSNDHCLISRGCQSEFGICNNTSSEKEVGINPVICPHDRCGMSFDGRICNSGQCCSKYGFCGTTTKHCSINNGCQPQFGLCMDEGEDTTYEPIVNPTGNPYWVGYRYSDDGLRSTFGKHKIPTPKSFMKYTENLRKNFSNNPRGAFILIVGTCSKKDLETIHFKFPKPSNIPSNANRIAKFDKKDSYENFLNKCDERGFDVWIQVEPGYNDLKDLANIVLERYGHHSSVKGFGIDLEWWYRKSSKGKGSKLDDKSAKEVVEEVQKRNPAYTVFAKHWKQSYMPDSYRNGMIFIDDSNDISSLSNMKEEFRDWAKKFDGNPVMFQIGYYDDHSKWEKDPMRFAKEIANAVSKYNEKIGIIWVDSSMKEFIEKENLYH